MSNLLWDEKVIEEIQKKAKGVKYKNADYKISFPTLDDLIVTPGQLERLPVDSFREKIDTKVVIGKEDMENPLTLQKPVFISSFSYGEISKSAKLAFALGAGLSGTAISTGEGGTINEEKEICKNNDTKSILQWSSGRFGVDLEYLNSGDAIEINVGRGHNPGLGEFLPFEKIDSKIAKSRGIQKGINLLSPPKHLDMDSGEDLEKHVELLREVTDYKIPIIVKITGGNVYEDTRIAIESGADAIAIDSCEDERMSNISPIFRHIGVPFIGIFAPAIEALKDSGEEDVKLLVNGPIRNGIDVFKALALGADAVGIGTAAKVAIGCEYNMDCYSGKCPSGVATHIPEKEENLNWRESGNKLNNYINSINDEIKLLTGITSHNKIEDITIEDVRALNYDSASITGAKLIGYERRLLMWEH